MADDDTIQTQAGAEPSDEQKAAQQAAQQAAMAQEAADKEAAEKAAAEAAAARSAAAKPAKAKKAPPAPEPAAGPFETALAHIDDLAPTGQIWLVGEDRMAADGVADGVHAIADSRWKFMVRDGEIVGACRSDHLDYEAFGEPEE